MHLIRHAIVAGFLMLVICAAQPDQCSALIGLNTKSSMPLYTIMVLTRESRRYGCGVRGVLDQPAHIPRVRHVQRVSLYMGLPERMSAARYQRSRVFHQLEFAYCF